MFKQLLLMSAMLVAGIGQQPDATKKPFGVPDKDAKDQAPPVVAQPGPVAPVGGLPAPPAAPCEWKEVTLPSANKIKGLELPPDQNINSSKRFVLITAVTDKPDQKVKWLVIGSVPWSQPSAITISNSKTLQVFPNAHADLIVVIAYSSLDGELTEQAVTRIQVDGPVPPAAPAAGPDLKGATPARAALTGPLHLTLLVANVKDAPAFSMEGVKLHVYDAKGLPADMQQPFASVPGPGTGPRYIIQSAAGDIVAKGWFSTAYDLTTAVEKVRGGQ
jgi:hypothetical protein